MMAFQSSIGILDAHVLLEKSVDFFQADIFADTDGDPSSDYKLHIEFTNGEQGIYDYSPLLDFGVFRELQDRNYLMKANAWDGTVVWPHEQDICPDTLYLDSVKKAGQGTIHGRP